VEQSLRRVATNVQAAIVPECGHWIPEEQPAFLISELRRFFGAGL